MLGILIFYGTGNARVQTYHDSIQSIVVGITLNAWKLRTTFDTGIDSCETTT